MNNAVAYDTLAADALQAHAQHGSAENRARAVEAVARRAFHHAECDQPDRLVQDMAVLFDLDAVGEARNIHTFLREVHAQTPAIASAAVAVLKRHRQWDLAREWGVAVDDTEVLSAPARIDAIWVNLTSRCNLRCVYCTVGQPGHVDRDIENNSLDKLMDFLARRPGVDVNLGCFTETTSYADWVPVLNRFLDLGANIHLTSNLAKLLDESEIDVMARVATLLTSIDTLDRERLKEKRKGADIRTILYNLTRIRGRARQLGRASPRLVWICVPRQETLDDLMEYVSVAITLGVSSIVVNPVLHFADSKEKIEDFLDASTDALRNAFTKLEQARVFAEAHGISCQVHNRDLMLERLNSPTPDRLPPGASRTSFQAALGLVSMYARRLPAGKTRLCTAPWRTVVFTQDGHALPCPIPGVPLAQLRDAGRVEDTTASADFTQWRRDLLAGQPPLPCANCRMAPEGTPEELKALVRRLPGMGEPRD